MESEGNRILISESLFYDVQELVSVLQAMDHLNEKNSQSLGVIAVIQYIYFP